MPPASRPTDRFLASTVATVPFMLLMFVLLVGSARAATAEEMPEGIKVGDGEVSIDGGEVYAGNGCAKAGDVVAGDCDDERAGADPRETTSPGAPSHEKTSPETTGQESTILTEETTALEITSPGITVPDGTDPCPTEPPEDAVEATVARVVDGDTLELADEVEGTDQVRLIGVDTPELEGEDGEPEPYAEESAAFTAEVLEGRDVLLQIGEEETDGYGRLLAHVWTGEATEEGFVGGLKRVVGMGGSELFNRTLLEEGYAEVLTLEQGGLYAVCFEAAEERARKEGLGIWGPDNGSSDGQYEEPTISEDTTLEETVLQDATTEQTSPETATPERSASPEAGSPDEDLPQESTEGGPATEDQYRSEPVPTEDAGSVPDYEKCDTPAFLGGFSGDGQQTENIEVPGGSFLVAYRTEEPSAGEPGLFLLDVYGPGGGEPVEEISYEEVGTERAYVEDGPGKFTFAASAENRAYDVAVYGCGDESARDEPAEPEPAQTQPATPPSTAEQAALPIPRHAADAPAQDTAYEDGPTAQGAPPSYAAQPDAVETSGIPLASLPTRRTSTGSVPVLPETGGASLPLLLLGAPCLAAGLLSLPVLGAGSRRSARQGSCRRPEDR